ncbi:MAG: cobalamin biosynthesis protein [Actinomycetia bacterium]|nr:cobalamin biosynthesis protein [Actinomycetes bacterium]
MKKAILVGWLADRAFGDPVRFHPVAGFGNVAGALERLVWRPRRAAGLVHTVVLVLSVALLARRRHAWFRAVVVWTALGGRSLERAALALADALRAGDVVGARALAPALVGRDPSQLDAPELSRAAVESVAENTSDAVVASLFWAAVGGAPAVAAHRAVNTLDAMVGHKHERYREFGWFAARLDDAVNWPAATLTVILATLAAPLVGGSPTAAWRAAWRDGRAHPSPNAGRVEGAFAGALGIRLGGVNRYAHGLERRADLGNGPAPAVEDIARAVKLARIVGGGALALALVAARR